MTRAKAIATVEAHLPSLPTDRLEVLADVVTSWSQPLVFANLPAEERRALDEALDSLDRGEGELIDLVEAELRAKVKAAVERGVP